MDGRGRWATRGTEASNLKQSSTEASRCEQKILPEDELELQCAKCSIVTSRLLRGRRGSIEQRTRRQSVRFDFTMVDQPGRMLTDCVMLSRYNTWTNEWRKEEASNKWTNEQQRTKNDHVGNVVQIPHSKLPIALLVLISSDGTKDPKATPSPIPRTHVNSKIDGANIVNRTLLASTCDRAPTMWILGTGAETATTAMTNLGLEVLPIRGTGKEKYWQSTNNVPNLKIFMSCIPQRQAALEETPEWIVVPLTQCFFLSIKQRDIFKMAITTSKALKSKSVICIWTTVDKQTEE